mgnify:CR=1 FL=1
MQQSYNMKDTADPAVSFFYISIENVYDWLLSNVCEFILYGK